MYISVWFPKLSVSIHSNTSIKWINCTTSRFFNFTASKLSMYAQFWCWVIGSWQMPSKSGESIEKVDNWWWMAVRMWLQFDRRTTAGEQAETWPNWGRPIGWVTTLEYLQLWSSKSECQVSSSWQVLSKSRESIEKVSRLLCNLGTKYGSIFTNRKKLGHFSSMQIISVLRSLWWRLL